LKKKRAKNFFFCAVRGIFLAINGKEKISSFPCGNERGKEGEEE